MKRITILFAILLFVTALARGQAAYLDNTFGDGGYLIVNPSGIHIAPYVMHLLPDGRILHCGWKENDPSKSRFYLMMHQNDGKIDSSFGDSGFSPVSAISGFVVKSLTTYSDGRILIYGYITEASSYKINPCIVRFLADGSIDNSFGTGGIYQDNNFLSGSYFINVKVHDDGSLTAIGAEKTSRLCFSQ
jgi:uncharacterized delta-60 repeat protein